MSLSSANLRAGLFSTMGYWQPEAWPYHPPPTPEYRANRHWVPPRALPWYYTCDPLYLLGWLALRVLPPHAAVGLGLGWWWG